MYSITEMSSFESVENWLGELEAYITEDTRVLLIGNKSDLSHQREVSRAEAIELSKEKKCAFLETSALDGANCIKAIQIILQEIHEIDNNTKDRNKKKTLDGGGSDKDKVANTGTTTIQLNEPNDNPKEKPKKGCCG